MGMYFGNPISNSDWAGLKCFRNEFGDTICDSWKDFGYDENWSEYGKSSAFPKTHNNLRYEQCFKRCMGREISYEYECTFVGAGAFLMTRSKKGAAATSQLCEVAMASSQCSLECGNLEELNCK